MGSASECYGRGERAAPAARPVSSGRLRRRRLQEACPQGGRGRRHRGGHSQAAGAAAQREGLCGSVLV